MNLQKKILRIKHLSFRQQLLFILPNKKKKMSKSEETTASEEKQLIKERLERTKRGIPSFSPAGHYETISPSRTMEDVTPDEEDAKSHWSAPPPMQRETTASPDPVPPDPHEK